MFIASELRNIKALVRTDIGPWDVFDQKELEAVGETQAKLMIENLFIPKHSRPLQTLILKKYFTKDFKLGEFFSTLAAEISGPYKIRIGASFFMQNPQEHLVKYFFSIYGRPINPDNQIMNSAQDVDKLCKMLDQLSNEDLLNRLYDDINDNPFEKSGLTVRRLGLAVFWISKINGSF